MVRLLGGTSHDNLAAAGRTYAAALVPGALRADMRDRLAWHRAAGHEIVIVSAALDVYLDAVARLLEVDAVMCTPPRGRRKRSLHGPDALWQLPRPQQGRAPARILRRRTHGSVGVRQQRRRPRDARHRRPPDESETVMGAAVTQFARTREPPRAVAAASCLLCRAPAALLRGAGARKGRRLRRSGELARSSLAASGDFSRWLQQPRESPVHVAVTARRVLPQTDGLSLPATPTALVESLPAALPRKGASPKVNTPPSRRRST